MKTFEPVKGFSFAPFVHAGLISTDEAKQSLLTMKERTASNFVILIPEALQEDWYEDMLSACDKRDWVDGEVF